MNDMNRPIAVHIRHQHPGTIDSNIKMKWTRVEIWDKQGRRQVNHPFLKRRPGQARGIPYLAPVLEMLKNLGDYSEAELFAAIISAMIAVVYKSPDKASLPSTNPTEDLPATDRDKEITFEAGTTLEIDSEDEVTVPNLGRPNANFDPYFISIVRQIGASLEIPFEVLIAHFTASYSASRAALMTAWQFFRTRRSWLANTWCQAHYEAFLFEAVAEGRLNAPGLFTDLRLARAWTNATWRGPARPNLDPLKEAKADEIFEDRGWKTSAEITEEATGGNWTLKHRRRSKEKKLREEAGLELPLTATIPQPPASDPDGDANTPEGSGANADNPEDETKENS